MGWTRYFATGATRDPSVNTREFAAYNAHYFVSGFRTSLLMHLNGYTFFVTSCPCRCFENNNWWKHLAFL